MTSKVYIGGVLLYSETAEEVVIDRAEWVADELSLFFDNVKVITLGGYARDHITFDDGFEATVKAPSEAPDDLTAALDVLLGVK